MTFGPPRTPDQPDNAASVRLDSWKEIAEYLGKVERTVKRWERERALPVHRPPGGRGSVYAYTSELDEWLHSTRNGDNKSTGVATQSADAEGGKGKEETPSMASLPPLPFLSQDEPLSKELASPAVLPARFSWAWRIPILIPLAVCVILGADLLAHRRADDARASSSSNHQPGKTIPALISSDAEKRLAHDLYLQGRFEWSKRTPDSLNRALDRFTQAIVHDPASAETYAGLADTYLLMHEYSLMPDHDAYSRAIAASRKAVGLDDSLAEAHRSLAFAEVWGDWDFQAGEKEFRRAIELDPRNPQTHLWFATAFNTPDWHSITLREFDRAQELDPTSSIILANKSIWLFQSGQKDAGLALARQVERTDPDFLAPHRYLSMMYWHLRSYQDFLTENEKMANSNHDPVLIETTAAARAGFDRDGERGLLHDLYLDQKELHAKGKISGTLLAETCVRLGRKEEALQLLQDDYDHHRAEFLWTLTDRGLLTLKDEPAYRELVNKLHFPAPPAVAEIDSPGQVSNQNEQIAAKHP
jgi:tetratricopeptide (TPR) repeat protein/predicted DNA-binding transcriptional regulator AlpA